MPNALQRIRAESIATIKKVVAKSMPTGFPDGKLRAYLSVQYGFSDSSIAEYLKKLEDANVVENQEGVWKIL